jgi:hypothetical protein
MPKADDLFRPTTEPDPEPTPAPAPSPAAADAGDRKPSGRVKHDAKMTVYITDDELMEIEHARLRLRRGQGIIVDRGRLVREALALVLAEYDAKGERSAIVKRLRQD